MSYIILVFLTSKVYSTGFEGKLICGGKKKKEHTASKQIDFLRKKMPNIKYMYI